MNLDGLMPIEVRNKGERDYQELWQEMKAWTRNRDAQTKDECWLASHPAVFTLGQAGTEEHLLANPHSIPVVQSDRGGQITYHGPGQLIFYLLLDVQRRHLGVKKLIWATEEIVIRMLAELDVAAHRRPNMPGVFVHQAKIAALGFRISRGRCYHGISVNHKPDLDVFASINPCGYENLAVTSLVNEGIHIPAQDLQYLFLRQLEKTLCYNIAHSEELYDYDFAG